MTSQTPSSALALEAQADRAAGHGGLVEARRLLDAATRAEPGRIEPWLKLAAICRGLGDLPGALSAVEGALTAEPLGFVPLLLKANILEKLGRQGEAGEIYGYALAQQPPDIPPHLESMIEHARRAHAAYLSAEDERLQKAQAMAGAPLTDAEEARLARLRSNILRKTRPYHSEPTHFHYPGLREREFHDPEHFPWLERLAAATSAIAEDFHRVAKAERAELVPYIQYPDSAPVRQWAELNRNPAWTAIHLIRNGEIVTANARNCPATMALLDTLDLPAIPGRGPNAMFSLLAPGAHIPPHNGVANTRLVCHLPLIVPDGCWFRVGAERRPWVEGEPWIFDDTIEHEAMNPSDRLRVILILDTWHPDLSPAERLAVSAILAASDSGGGAQAL